MVLGTPKVWSKDESKVKETMVQQEVFVLTGAFSLDLKFVKQGQQVLSLVQQIEVCCDSSRFSQKIS